MSDAKPITETAVQKAIAMCWRSQSYLMMPNYTPDGWWECDVWRVMKSRYSTEYEVKVTVSDFRADAKKSKQVVRRGAWCDARKYDEIGSESGPNRFYYVVPESIAQTVECELPDWAGLFVFRGYAILNRARDAPVLHKAKTTEQAICLAQSRAVHRYWKEWSINRRSA